MNLVQEEKNYLILKIYLIWTKCKKKNHLELIQGIFFRSKKFYLPVFLISLCQIGHKVSIFLMKTAVNKT